MNPERAGRDGALRLRFARRGAKTVLSESRFTLPLQVLTPLEMEDGTSYLMLLNPTGGVLGGDRLTTKIIQEPHTHVCLTTPSATRIYRTAQQPAILDTTIKLGESATLEYLPDHVIPHVGSALRQSLRLEMAQGSRAIILDSMASGRVAHGERWSFTEMDSRMEISICGKPAFLNRTKINPLDQSPRRPGAMGGFDYMACMGIVADGIADWQRVAAALTDELESEPKICGGVSQLSHHGCLVRFLTRSATEMTRMNKQLWDAARELIIGLTAFDHRKY